MGPDPLDRVLDEISRHRTVLVASHDHLDGDALGSEIALAALLAHLGCEGVVVNPGPVPGAYRFLRGAASLHSYPEGLGPEGLGPEGRGPEGRGPLGQRPRFDALVCVDCSRLDRIDPVRQRIPRGLRVVNIDHHDGNDRFGDLNWVDPSRSSTGEMLYDLTRRAGAPLDEGVATALYVAVATDTGGFRFSNTTPAAHRMAADLLERGVRPEEIHRRLHLGVPRGRLRLEALALDRLRTDLGGRIAWAEVTEEMLRETGVDQDDLRELVDLPTRLAGVEVALLFRVAPGGGTRVSFRSNGSLAVNRFAATYGGGGHPRAAGCTLPETLPRAVARVIRDLKEALGGEP